VQKFLPIFCTFFIIIKKSIHYKLIKIFSIVFYDFFPSFRNSSSSTAAGHPERSLSLRSKSSFLNRLNQFAHVQTFYNIFTISQIILCIYSTFLLVKTKQKTVANCSLSSSISNHIDVKLC